MPYHHFALPVSATNLSVERNGYTHPLLLDTDTFDRAGEDGDIPILPINGGDEFVGESLEGQWHRAWDSNIDTFTATISGGTLRLTGVAAIAGTSGNGWINSQHPAPLVDETEITVSMEVPVDDTGVTASRDIRQLFFLRSEKEEDVPTNDNNYIQIRIDVDENGLLLQLFKRVSGASTTLDFGHDYTMDGTRSTGNLEATIWRIVFNNKPGTSGATMNVYLKQAATLALAEVATENELDGSPYDISDLAFNVAYPAYQIYTQNTTYFGTTYDSANRAASTYLRFDYPSQFNVKYDWTEADYGEGDVELWDGDPDSGGVRVYDEDHEFSSNPYIQNGLIRLIVTEASNRGLFTQCYISGAWSSNLASIEMYNGTVYLTYPSILDIIYISPEKIIIKVRLRESATIDEDSYIDVEATIKRGSYIIEIEETEIYPIINHRTQLRSFGNNMRFGYVGNNAIGDQDLAITGQNVTQTDNFGLMFDDDGTAMFMGFGNQRLSTTYFRTFQGYWVHTQDTDVTNLPVRFFFFVVPFSLVANLFEEAESATLGGGATAVADALASGGQAALLDAQNETVTYDVTSGTELPAGTYLIVFRARDLNQVANDLRIRIQNSTDSENRVETNAVTDITLTASYAYYSYFSFITDTDVTGTDNFRIRLTKVTANANEIYVDYFLIVPIGDGMNWPQDLAHSALRGVTQHPRLCER